MTKIFRLDEFGFEVEVGRIARQADGAVWFKQGGTVVLATATASPMKDFPGFFPLSIDYREQFSAAGKIPGGYYKREGRLSDREILTSRLIDRALRPLFPDYFFDQVQVLSTVYSVDKNYIPNTISLIASSLALVISDVPFLEPVAAVEMARIDGEWIFFPTYEQSVISDTRIVVAGTKEGVCMVEGSANELSESAFAEILFKAHDIIEKIVDWQLEIQSQVGVAKRAITDPYGWALWKEKINTFLTVDRVENMFIEDKSERSEYLSSMKQAFNDAHEEHILGQKIPQGLLDYLFESVLKLELTDLIFKKQKRIDGRNFDMVRPITIEVGLLPFVHGSSLFTRGQTQALIMATLGSGDDVQRVESIMEKDEGANTFMLHYNFLPFSTGEVKPMRGPGRREIGHGYLARSSFEYVLPKKEDFPYTLRIVSDILESNGSSSMATVCGTTMALMHAGVPIKKMISGVAMGLVQSSNGDFMTLTDITGTEDAFGLMDFKVTGTRDGITAIQMDIKYKGGLPRKVFESALEQARLGRLHILGEMEKVMSKPNAELSELVPKVVTMKIATDKIGAVIGSGGKTIREIIEATKTSIDIDPDGTVKIFGEPDALIEKAISWIKTLTGQIEIGQKFSGIVRRVVEFGIFIELVPGQDGLLHVSNIPSSLKNDLAKKFKNGDQIEVAVSAYDEATGKIGLKMIDQTAGHKAN